MKILVIAVVAIGAGIMLLYDRILAGRTIDPRANKSAALLECFIWGAYSLAVMLVFAYATGILKSGFHYVDDHEIIYFNRAVKSQGLLSPLLEQLKIDRAIRFRPLYWVIRTIRIALYENNFFIWHVERTVEAALVLFCGYIVVRKIGCSMAVAALLSQCLLIGEHSAIIWRLGVLELDGLLILTLTLICAVWYHQNRNLKCFILLSVLTAMTCTIKESFILVTPLVAFLLIWLDFKEGNGNIKEILNSIKRYRAYICVNLCMVAASLLWIVFGVGTNGIGYAGIDPEFTLRDYLYGIKAICFGNLMPYLTMLLVLGLTTIMCIYILRCRSNGGDKSQVVTLFLPGCFVAAYAVGTQVLMHCKSGMMERYLMPCVFFIYLTVAIWMTSMKWKSKKIRFLYALICVGLLLNILTRYDICKDAQGYGSDGYKITYALTKTGEIVSDRNTMIVWECGDNLDISALKYLQIEYGIEHVYTYNNVTEQLEDQYIENVSKEMFNADISDIEMYVGFAPLLLPVLEKYEVDLNNYIKENLYGGYVIYYHK